MFGEIVRISILTSSRGITFGVIGSPHGSKLGQVCFPDEYGASFPQESNNAGILRNNSSY
jgi:hypothetical protein